MNLCTRLVALLSVLSHSGIAHSSSAQMAPSHENQAGSPSRYCAHRCSLHTQLAKTTCSVDILLIPSTIKTAYLVDIIVASSFILVASFLLF